MANFTFPSPRRSNDEAIAAMARLFVTEAAGHGKIREAWIMREQWAAKNPPAAPAA